MATLIERVGRQALFTFANRSTITIKKFEENFEMLKRMADELTAADVNFNLENLPVGRRDSKRPPVTYIKIYEDPYVSIGIFVLRPGEKLPLHDHPQMYGILKVIAGTVKVQSYSIVNNLPLAGKVLYLVGDKTPHRLSAIKFPPVTVNENSTACYLTPEEQNLHEISSVDGAAAFLDILAPPYDANDAGAEQTCHYFKEEKPNGLSEGEVTLLTIPTPPEYWNDTALYEGPKIRY
ncbi:2-aminoethanethiol dioxygenase [Blattella germanica]|nr:2-aminoethanethiol dioxygenase [Blattella germanica]